MLSFVRRKRNTTYHPVAALLRLFPLDVDLELLGTLVILGLNGLRKFRQLVDGARCDKLLVVQVVNEEVQPLLRVLHLRRKGGGGFASYPLHV